MPRSTPKGRQPEANSRAHVRGLLGPAPYRRDLLIEYLHKLHDVRGHITDGDLVALAEALRISQAEVYEVASFYHHFDVVKAGQAPPPEVTVRVCDSLSCTLGGAEQLLANLHNTLGSNVRVLRSACMGRCAAAPACCVGQRELEHATAQTVQTAIDQGNTSPATLQPMGLPQYTASGGYALLKSLASGQISPEAIIETLSAANLRGLGGAGFPTGRKWKIVRAEPAPRYLCVNLDEGDVGTFKDRVYLERDPHRFLEGMLIAARVVDADKVFIYLRDEYHACRAMLQAELAALQANPPCPLPRIELRRGAGAYICGEESAMIESIEGKRGMPRLRPPFVAQVGVFDRPTLVNNFETLYWVREILERGADWFASHGRNGRKGLRSFSVSGRVKNPGVHLAPAGITLRQLVDEFCGGMADGHALYGYFCGGSSGGILPASMADLPLDFDTLNPHGCFIGSAAIIVLGHRDSARDAAQNVMKFLAHESCGQCTPCRVGTDRAAGLMTLPDWDAPLLEDLCMVMTDASICGLGQAAGNPIRSVIKWFGHELEGKS